jgi:hypothetical protein
MPLTDPIWRLHSGSGPLIAAAIHDGHSVREEVAPLLALDDAARLREEDPFTGQWAELADTRMVGLRSRFEVDLNRPRERAVYIKPEDAWGLTVWHRDPPEDLVARSLVQYDAFYEATYALLKTIEQRHGHFVVFDLHTYNHRREGPTGPEADPELNPQVNIGTGTMQRERWAPLVDRFMRDLHSYDYMGRHLDVRENVKFRGGQFSQWVHENFPASGCSLAIEFKKFFMDEWTGKPDPAQVEAIGDALRSTVPGVLKELR